MQATWLRPSRPLGAQPGTSACRKRKWNILTWLVVKKVSVSAQYKAARPQRPPWWSMLIMISFYDNIRHGKWFYNMMAMPKTQWQCDDGKDLTFLFRRGEQRADQNHAVQTIQQTNITLLSIRDLAESSPRPCCSGSKALLREVFRDFLILIIIILVVVLTVTKQVYFVGYHRVKYFRFSLWVKSRAYSLLFCCPPCFRYQWATSTLATFMWATFVGAMSIWVTFIWAKFICVLCKKKVKMFNLVTRRAFEAQESRVTKSDQRAQITEGKYKAEILIWFINVCWSSQFVWNQPISFWFAFF